MEEKKEITAIDSRKEAFTRVFGMNKLKRLAIILCATYVLLSPFLAVITPKVSATGEVLIDSFPETEWTDEFYLDSLHPSASSSGSAAGQTFTCLPGYYAITSVKFYLRKIGLATGIAHAVLYAITGTYGADATPTDNALATSDGFEVSTLTADFQLVTFTFNDSQQFIMQPNTHYSIAYENPASGTIDEGDVCLITSAIPGAHSGNSFDYHYSTWFADVGVDVTFYVYGVDASPAPAYTYLPDLFTRGTTTATFYMRSDMHTVNGQYAYVLNATESAADQTVTNSITSDTNETAYWGVRFYLTYSDNSTSELTNGYPETVTLRTTNGSGIQTGNWLSPYVDFTLGNIGTTAIKTLVYTRFGDGTWQLQASFVSDWLEYRTLMNTTWTIYLYTSYTITQPSNYNLTSSITWGDTAHPSRIEDVEFMNALPYELMTNDLGKGNLIGFLFRPYLALMGTGFYGFILLFIFYPIYRHTQSFTVVMALMMLLGGAGGYFLKTLIPAAGFEFGWILFAFGLAGLIYKIIRSFGGG